MKRMEMKHQLRKYISKLKDVINKGVYDTKYIPYSWFHFKPVVRSFGIYTVMNLMARIWF